MRTRTALLTSLLLAATACSKPATDTGSGDAALKTTLHAYVVEFLKRNPTTNTYLGGAGFDPALRDVDGTLRDHSAAALTSEDSWLEDQRKTIDAVAPQALSPKIGRASWRERGDGAGVGGTGQGQERV